MSREAQFHGRFPADPRVLHELRSEAVAAAMAAGITSEREPDVHLVVSEAATNVILHAYDGDEGDRSIELAVVDTESEVVIVVADEGPGLRPRPDSPGAGLGLSIVEAIADRLEIADRSPGTEVRIAFRKTG